MTARDAARRLEVSQSLIYKLCSEGRLPHVRIGQEGRRGAIRISEAGIQAFLKACEPAGR